MKKHINPTLVLGAVCAILAVVFLVRTVVLMA